MGNTAISLPFSKSGVIAIIIDGRWKCDDFWLESFLNEHSKKVSVGLTTGNPELELADKIVKSFGGKIISEGNYQENTEGILLSYEPTTQGGPGSGHFGHIGRPGEVGGSGGGSKFVSETRGHISLEEDVSDKEYDRLRIDDVMKTTGMDEYGAEQAYLTIRDYSCASYTDIRDGTNKIGATVLENYINKAPKWPPDIPIYRGIKIMDEYKEIIPNFFDKVVPNAVINMNGLSSWSSEKTTASRFAMKERKGDQGIVFKVVSPKKAVSISHLAVLAREKEVLVSSKSRFRVHSVDRKRRPPMIELQEVSSEEILGLSEEIQKTISSFEKRDEKPPISLEEKWEIDSSMISITPPEED